VESDKIGQERLAAVGKACTPEAIEKAAVQLGWLAAYDTNKAIKRPVVGGGRGRFGSAWATGPIDSNGSSRFINQFGSFWTTWWEPCLGLRLGPQI
jgi:hypothetical protein